MTEDEENNAIEVDLQDNEELVRKKGASVVLELVWLYDIGPQPTNSIVKNLPECMQQTPGAAEQVPRHLQARTTLSYHSKHQSLVVIHMTRSGMK